MNLSFLISLLRKFVQKTRIIKPSFVMVVRVHCFVLGLIFEPTIPEGLPAIYPIRKDDPLMLQFDNLNRSGWKQGWSPRSGFFKKTTKNLKKKYSKNNNKYKSRKHLNEYCSWLHGQGAWYPCYPLGFRSHRVQHQKKFSLLSLSCLYYFFLLIREERDTIQHCMYSYGVW